jgi:hypothetical protein
MVLMLKGKPRFELLDQYVFQRNYTLALEAIAEEITRRPENFNLLLRQAEILGLAGERGKAISVYRKVAEHYATQGFYARAIAVTNKVLRLDPNRQDVTKDLAQLIAVQQATEKEAEAKLKSAEKEGLEQLRHAEPPPQAPPPPVATDPAQQQVERERAASHFFAEFPQGALEQLLYSAAVRSFDPEDVIVQEGDPGTSFFLIADGDVVVHTNDPSGKPMVLAQLGAGEFFGEVAVLTGKPRTATIVAKTPATVIEISGVDLDRIVAEYPDVRTVLQHFYEQRARATVEAMLARIRGGNV